MIADGGSASISSALMEFGTTREETWHSRTRRAISWAYWAPKATTSTRLLVLGRRGRTDQDPRDPTAVELGHGQLPAGHFGRFAVLRQVPQRGKQVARHRLIRPFGQFQAGLLGELV